MGCSTAQRLLQIVGQTISHLKSAEPRNNCGKILSRRHDLAARRRKRPSMLVFSPLNFRGLQACLHPSDDSAAKLRKPLSVTQTYFFLSVVFQ
jgi:hypothetical protein